MKSTCGLSNKGKVRNICGDCAEVLPREVAALAAQNTPSVVVLAARSRRARGAKHPVRRRARPAAQGLRQKGRRRAAFRRPRQDRLHLMQPGDPRARRRAVDAKV